MPPSGFEAAPERLVDGGRQRLGRFDGPPRQVNLLDARYRGLPRPVRWWRLKEWQAFQIATPRLFVNVALFDAKLMSLFQVKVFDKATQTKFLHEKKLPPGAFRVADQLLDSKTAYDGRLGRMSFENRLAIGRVEIDIDVPASSHAPRVSGRLAVLIERGASQVVSLPFEHGGMYSHKGMFPVEGALMIGEETHLLSPGDALALMDDHKGYYPYVMQWDWVTSATHDARGRALGINLTHNQCRDPEQFNENCAWIDDKVGRLPAVSFERANRKAPGEVWRIRDRAGRVDVTFEPTVPGDVRVNAVVVESRYRGPFGVLSGRVEPEGLEPVTVDGWFGMGEEFWLRC